MIEAITVCVNYSDYLSNTLPLLASRVDRVVVVTSTDDSATCAIADRLGVECLRTDAFRYCHGKPCSFNKGAAINVGLRNLSRSDWVLHIDSDIALLDTISEPPAPELLYGATRCSVVGAEGWWKLMRGDHSGFASKPCYSKLPSGYFQLWHWPTNSIWYPEYYGDASQSDWEFASNWALHDIRYLQGVIAWHLEMPNDQYRANWKGRTTDRFTGCLSPDLAEGQQSLER